MPPLRPPPVIAAEVVRLGGMVVVAEVVAEVAAVAAVALGLGFRRCTAVPLIALGQRMPPAAAGRAVGREWQDSARR